MGEGLKTAAWVVGIAGVVAAWMARGWGAPWLLVLPLTIACALGGVGVLVTRRFTLAGRFGGHVVVEGRPASLWGFGLVVGALALPFFGWAWSEARAHGGAPSPLALGGGALVLGLSLTGIGAGMGAHFVRDGWRRSVGSPPPLRILGAVFLAWAYGWLGLVGLGLMAAAVVILVKAP